MEEVLVVISCFVNIILWLFFFFYFKKKFSSQQILENIRQEVDKLLIEISRETDRDLSLIEDKVNELKEIIETADQRIKLAKKEQRRQKKEEAELEKKAEIVHVQEVIPPVEPIIETPVYSVDNVIRRYNEIDPKTNVMQNEKPIREKVLELWKLGMEPEKIAEKLAVSLAEISMIIDLYG